MNQKERRYLMTIKKDNHLPQEAVLMERMLQRASMEEREKKY